LKSQLAELGTEIAARAKQDAVALDLFENIIPEDPRIVVANQRLVHGGVQGIFAFRSSAAASAYRKLLSELEGRMQS
jgi:hypothetical protein